MRLFLFTFLILMLLFTPLGGIFDYVGNVFAQEVTDNTGYPYVNGPTCATGNCTPDQWAFFQRECTSYAAWRVNQDKGSSYSPFFFHNTIFGEGDRRFSDAGKWDNALDLAMTNGYNPSFYYDYVPAVGAIAQWESGTYGHVAYVEKVHSNGNIDVSEYNFNLDGKYGYRTNIAPADRYFHFNSPNDGMTGSLSGNVYNSDGTINTNPVLITATVISDTENNMDFYYIKSYLGSYEFDKMTARDGDTIIIRATDGVKGTTIEGVSVFPDIPDIIYTPTRQDIRLDNVCHYTDVGSINAFCGNIPFIANATWGGQYVLSGASGSGGVIQSTTIPAPVCTSAPTTSSTVTGATQGNNGWWRSSTQVSFYASAPCGSDNLKTYYKINNGSQQQYSGPFTINQEGIHNITYYSVDKLGNTESTKSVQVKIDWTPPVTSGNATGPRDTNGIFRDNVTAGLSSTDNLSGVESQQRSMDGGTNWITMNGSNNTFQITGNGVSRFVFRATDNAGNQELFKDSGPIIINKYVIYSNGTADSLRFTNTTGVNITGDIYSGGTTTFGGNTGGIFGTTFKTVGTSNLIKNTNTNIQVPSIVTGVSSVPMLSYPLSLYKSLATVVFPSDLYLDSVSSQLKGILYVEGNVKMVDVGLSGPVSIVATGSINDVTTDSTFQTGDPNNGVLLYAGTNIEVNSTGNRNLGLMYAPNGVVKIRATGLTLKGSLVGKEVELYGATNFNLSYNAAFASSTHVLPLVAMGLNIPTTIAPAVPSLPALSKPSNSATGISNTRPKISWYSSTGAVGYNLQVSTSSTFSTLTYNGSVLSTGVSSMSLSKSTKYYWRVRSINQGGMSVWSTIRSFTTQN